MRKFIFLPIVLFVTILSTQHVNAQTSATLHVYNYQALGTYKNTTDLKITVAYN